jgi:hypothetical protein
MHPSFAFFIRPLSLEKGFILECEGVIEEPLRFCRLFEAVLAAGQIGQGLQAEVKIFNTEGEVAETLEMHGARALFRP